MAAILFPGRRVGPVAVEHLCLIPGNCFNGFLALNQEELKEVTGQITASAERKWKGAHRPLLTGLHEESSLLWRVVIFPT